jgi:streptomycin 6-kinase
LMVWWNGSGAAKVLMYDSAALLLERATGTVSLKTMAQQSAAGDDEATRILCRAVRKIHIPSSRSLPDLVPLKHWFRDLGPMANQHGGILTHCGKAANDLLNEPQDEGPLHGDIHHENVLDFGERGWLVIDPKGLYGEGGFDYANLFCNPDEQTAILPGRLARQVEIVAAEAGLERQRLLRWVLAWAGLSAAWTMGDNLPAEATLRVAEIAAAGLRA